MAFSDEWCNAHKKPKHACKVFHDLAASSGSIFDEDGPIGASQEGIILHEIFTSYVSAGFTSSQALYMTAAIATGNPGPAPASPEDQADGSHS